MPLIQLTERNKDQHLQEIMDLEKEAEYPLGEDTFKIDHGADYFAFFKRLGDLRYFAWIQDRQVAAVAAGIIRQVPSSSHGKFLRAWYLCDLKVKRNFRRQHIPLKMLSRAFLPNYLRCPRGYAISMNKAGESENRVVRLLSRFWLVPIRAASQLLIWSCDRETIVNLLPLIEKHRGRVGFLSLAGIKDIVLQSSDHNMPLYHLQFGPLADQDAFDRPQAEGVYMFCSPESDSLAKEILARNVFPTSTATIVAHNMSSADWSWVLTSDI